MSIDDAATDSDTVTRGFGATQTVAPFGNGARGAVFLVANWDYGEPPGRLIGPKADLAELEIGYTAAGMAVVARSNLVDRAALFRDLTAFLRRCKAHAGLDAARFPIFFHFSGHGHGISVAGEQKNFLLMTGVSEGVIGAETLVEGNTLHAVSIDEVIDALAFAPGLRIGLTIDACRDRPQGRGATALAGGRFLESGTRPLSAWVDDPAFSNRPGWLGVYFSTAFGFEAHDTGDTRSGASLFSDTLARRLRQASLSPFRRSFDDVLVETGQIVAHRARGNGQRMVRRNEGNEPPPPMNGRRFWRGLVRAAPLVTTGLIGGIMAWGLLAPRLQAPEGSKVSQEQTRPAPSPPPAPPVPGQVEIGSVAPPPAQGEFAPAPSFELTFDTPVIAPPTQPPLKHAVDLLLAPAPTPQPHPELARLRATLAVAKAQEAMTVGDMVAVAARALAATEGGGAAPDPDIDHAAMALLSRAVIGIRPPARVFEVPELPRVKPSGIGGVVGYETAFSRDGRWFAVATGGGGRIFDTTNGQPIASFRHATEIQSMDFNGPGTMLVAIGGRAITIVPVGEPVAAKTWPLAQNVLRGGHPELSPDGTIIAEPLKPSGIVLRDVATGAALGPVLATESEAARLVFASDGRRLAALVPGTGIVTWTLPGRERNVVRLPKGSFATPRFSDNGRLLLIDGDEQGPVILHDLQRGTNRWSFDKSGLGTSFSILDNSGLVAQFGHDGTVAIHDTSQRGKRSLQRRQFGPGVLGSRRVSPDGEAISALTADNRLIVWRWRSDTVLVDAVVPFGRWTDYAFSADGRSLLLMQPGAVAEWPLVSPDAPMRVPGLDPEAYAFAISPDGRRFAASSRVGTVLWDVEAGRVLRRIDNDGKKGEDSGRSMDFSVDSRFLVLGPASEDGMVVRRLDAATGAELDGFESRVERLGTLRPVFSRIDPLRLFLLGVERLWDIALDARWPGRASRITVKQQGLLEQAAPGQAAATLAVTYNYLHEMSVVNLDDRSRQEDRARMRGHEGLVISTILSADRTTLFSASLDKTVRIWDVGTGRERVPFQRIPEAVEDIAVSNDGALVAILTKDSSIHRWKWRENAFVTGKPLHKCAEAKLHGGLVLCQAEPVGVGRAATVRDVMTGAPLGSFAPESRILPGGRFLLEPDGTIHKLFQSRVALLEAAHIRLEPHRAAADAALVSLQ